MKDNTTTTTRTGFKYDLGTFDGYDRWNRCALSVKLTAQEVINWDRAQGFMEFRPSGDHPGVALVFRGQTSMTGLELHALGQLLDRLGGDNTENFLRIYHYVRVRRVDLSGVEGDCLEGSHLHIFWDTDLATVREQAALALFAEYFPLLYSEWELAESHGEPRENQPINPVYIEAMHRLLGCDGLMLDVETFLALPMWSIEEVTLGDQVALLIVRL